MAKFFEREFELESRVLGDIDYHADNPDNFQPFFDFTIDEIRLRYQEFLHFVTEPADATQPAEEEPAADPEAEAEQQEEQATKEIDDNLKHEVEELRRDSIEAAYFDHNYWKPYVDYNMDELLSEINRGN